MKYVILFLILTLGTVSILSFATGYSAFTKCKELGGIPLQGVCYTSGTVIDVN